MKSMQNLTLSDMIESAKELFGELTGSKATVELEKYLRLHFDTEDGRKSVPTRSTLDNWRHGAKPGCSQNLISEYFISFPFSTEQYIGAVKKQGYDTDGLDPKMEKEVFVKYCVKISFDQFNNNTEKISFGDEFNEVRLNAGEYAGLIYLQESGKWGINPFNLLINDAFEAVLSFKVSEYRGRLIENGASANDTFLNIHMINDRGLFVDLYFSGSNSGTEDLYQRRGLAVYCDENSGRPVSAQFVLISDGLKSALSDFYRGSDVLTEHDFDRELFRFMGENADQISEINAVGNIERDLSGHNENGDADADNPGREGASNAKRKKRIRNAVIFALIIIAAVSALFICVDYFRAVKSSDENSESFKFSKEKDSMLFGSHQYKVFDGDALNISTWDEAEAYCELLGGHLATITSSDENTALFLYVTGSGYESAYFGLSDAEEEGVWKWVTGEPYDYSNWHEGEPNNEYNSEHYGMLYKPYYYGTWNDGSFSYLRDTDVRNFICEWERIGAVCTAG